MKMLLTIMVLAGLAGCGGSSGLDSRLGLGQIVQAAPLLTLPVEVA